LIFFSIILKVSGKGLVLLNAERLCMLFKRPNLLICRFGTIPNGATDYVVKNNFPDMHDYMKKWDSHFYTFLHIIAHSCPFFHIIVHYCTFLHILAHSCTFLHSSYHYNPFWSDELLLQLTETPKNAVLNWSTKFRGS
jgi:hypothetical protein